MITIPGKVPIKIYPFFWVLVLLISGINTNFAPLTTFLWVLVIFISVIVHEFGHALTAMAFGQKAHIDLVGFGGVTHRHGPRLTLPQEFLIVLNGPLAGLALGILSYYLLQLFGDHTSKVLQYVLTITFYANLFWTAVNLLPVQPLDGGHLLRIFLQGIFGLRGVKISLFISLILSVAVSVGFFLMQFFLAGAFFLMFTFESYRSWKNSLSLTEKDEDLELQHILKTAEKDYRKGNLDFALEKLNVVRDRSKAGVLYVTSSQLIAEILNKESRFQEAYDILLPLKSKLNEEKLILLHQLAYRLSKWQEAISLGNYVYQHNPSYEIALINALSHGILGEAIPAVGWLKCAVNEGMPNLKDVLRHVQFDPIRKDPVFQGLEHNVAAKDDDL